MRRIMSQPVMRINQDDDDDDERHVTDNHTSKIHHLITTSHERRHTKIIERNEATSCILQCELFMCCIDMFFRLRRSSLLSPFLEIVYLLKNFLLVFTSMFVSKKLSDQLYSTR
jgi:hypothetical protein